MHTSINFTDDIYSCDMYVCLQIKKHEGKDVFVTFRSGRLRRIPERKEVILH